MLLKVKTCLSLAWDKNNSVYGVVLSKKGRKIQIKDFASNNEAGLTFSQRLSSVYKALNGDTSELTVVGGYIQGALTFSVDVPNLKPTELKKFLEFEIPRYIPGSIDDFVWTFRPVIYPDADKNKITKAKILVVKRSLSDEIFNCLVDSQIKYDAALTPFFVIDPLYMAFNLYMEGMDAKFYSNASYEEEGWLLSELPAEEVQREAIIEETLFAFQRYEEGLGENLPHYIPALIMAEYALNPDFPKESKNYFPVPAPCKPKRFKGLKNLTFLLVGVFVLLACVYLIRETYDNHLIISAQQKEIKELTKIQKVMKSKFQSQKKNDDYIQILIAAQPETIDALSFLDYLSKVTPADTWANYLNIYGDSANLTMQTRGDADKLTAALYRSQDYTLQNSRKNKSADGTEYIYLNIVKKQTNPVETDNQ